MMPEPQAMTLEEALVYLARNREGQRIDDPDYDVGIQALPDGKWLGYTHLDSGHFRTWPEAFAWVLRLRVPVVERDPAAELAEALKDVLNLDWEHYILSDRVPERREAANEVVESAEAALAKWKEGHHE